MIYNIIINKTGGNTFNQRRITMSKRKLPVVPSFRAWDKHGQKMFSGAELIIWNNNVYANDGKELSCDYLKGWSIDEKYLMQSTGLLDRNRKEIFEGDIVARNGEETLSIVRKGILYSILGFYIETERNGTKIFEHINPHVPFVYTIVGNIYENPELLGQ